MIVVSAGWGETCATFKNITKTQYHDLDFKCNGQLQNDFPFPNGGELIAAAVSQLIDKLLLIFS